MNGAYSFSDLEAGTYHVEFNPPGFYADPDYANETYDNKALLTDGSNLLVTASSMHTNIDASLAPASTISGHVYAPDGVTGLMNISVQAHQWNGYFWRSMGNSPITDTTGSYTIGGLAAGPYRVEYTDDITGDYISQVYSNASDLTSGMDIVLPLSGTVSNINVSLSTAGKISGTVLTTNGTPADGTVDVLTWNGSSWDEIGSGGDIDFDGKYSAGGLSGGVYRVKFKTWDDELLDEVYDDQLEVEYGNDVVVTEGFTVSNINAVLDSKIFPPRIIRLSVEPDQVEIAYISTNSGSAVLQGVNALSNDWSNLQTDFAFEGVNTIIKSGSNEPIHFLRISTPTSP